MVSLTSYCQTGSKTNSLNTAVSQHLGREVLVHQLHLNLFTAVSRKGGISVKEKHILKSDRLLCNTDLLQPQ